MSFFTELVQIIFFPVDAATGPLCKKKKNQKTTNRFLQQHISYNFYLQKCLVYQAAAALSNSSLPSTLWVALGL